MQKIIVIVGLTMLAVMLSGCEANTKETPMPEVEMELVPMISVTGEVVPAAWATLSAQTGGTVMEVLIEAGDEVAAGDLLVQLDPTDAQLAVQQAETALETAQAQLALLRAGARSEEIAAAREAVAAAQSNLAAAQSDHAAAQAELARLEAGPKPDEITAAKAGMQKALVAMQLAQAEYDKIAWQEGIGATPQGVALQQASVDYAAAKAAHDTLVSGATKEELDIARANVDAAKARADVARAQLGQTQAQLDELVTGPTAEALAVAEAQIEQARTALAQAEAALQDTELAAPFPGTVAEVAVREGESVATGQPIMFLGDLSHLRVETTDLDETYVARVAVGQRATITFDALPERAFTGHVTRISPMAEPDAGGVNYTVIVELDETDPALRWGMTAFVDIEVGE